ncbi:MAG TPA: hypothetical protein VMR86_06370 [Myxococcota bacterium]|nr:hypothetical protein [Myxococcota bacterium]
MKLRWSLAIALSALCLTAYEKPQPDAKLALSATQIAAGVGFAWGTGTLTYDGKDYPVSVDGITVGAVGIASATAEGDVYHLKKVEDIAGNYTGAAAGTTVGGGRAGLVMRNQNGVEIRLTATTKGVSLTIGSTGVTLSLKK